MAGEQDDVYVIPRTGGSQASPAAPASSGGLSAMAPGAGQGDAGRIEAGNIDLSTRPTVRNPDGSISTVRSMSFGQDGREILVPTISDDGRTLSEQEAIAQYQQTGRHLGIFRTPEAATAYAEQLHRDQERQYASGEQGTDDTYVIPSGSRPDGDRSVLGDAWRGFASSAVGTAATAAGAAEFAMGSGGAATYTREYLTRVADRLASEMSPQMRQALSREFVPGGEGESAWSSFGAFFGSVAAQMAATTGSLVSAAPAVIAAGLAGPYAVPVATAVAAATGGALGAGTVWNDAAQAFTQLDEERRLRNPTYARLRGEGVDQASAINETVREAATGAVQAAGIGSAAINAFTGSFLGHLGSGHLGGVRAGISHGLRSETPTEFLEEGLQADQSQRVRERLTGEPYSLQQTAENAVRGGIAGGGLGAASGGVGGMFGRGGTHAAGGHEGGQGEQPPAATPQTPGVDPSVSAALESRPTAQGGRLQASDPLGAIQWAGSEAATSAAPSAMGVTDPSIVAALADQGQGTNPAGSQAGTVGALAQMGQQYGGIQTAPSPVPQLAQEGALTNVAASQPDVVGTLADQGAAAPPLGESPSPVPQLAQEGALTNVAASQPDVVGTLADQGAAAPPLGEPPSPVPQLAQEGVLGDFALRGRLRGPVPRLAAEGAAEIGRTGQASPLSDLARAGAERNRWNPSMPPAPQQNSAAGVAPAATEPFVAPEGAPQAAPSTPAPAPQSTTPAPAPEAAPAAQEPSLAPVQATEGLAPATGEQTPKAEKPRPAKKGIVTAARSSVRSQALQRARAVMERALGEEAYNDARDDVGPLVDTILEDAAREAGTMEGKSVAEVERSLMSLVMPRLEDSLRQRVAEVRQEDARAQEPAAGSPGGMLEGAETTDPAKARISKRDAALALDGNTAALRKVLGKFGSVAQKNLPAWFKRNFSDMIAERGKGEPEWATRLRKIAESAKAGGSAAQRAARTAEIESIRQEFAGQAANNEAQTADRARAVSTAFDEAKPANAAKESPRERMTRYKQLRQEIGKTLGTNSLAAQKDRIGGDARASAILDFLAKAGRGTDSNFDADVANSFALPELLIRAGDHKAALDTMRAEADVNTSGLGTGGESDTETARQDEAADIAQLDDMEVSGAELSRLTAAATELTRDALRKADPARAITAEDTQGNLATDEDLAAYRAKRSSATTQAVVAKLKAPRAPGQTLSLGKRGNMDAGITDASAMVLVDPDSAAGEITMGGNALLGQLMLSAESATALDQGLVERLTNAVGNVPIRIIKNSIWEKHAGKAGGLFVPVDMKTFRDGKTEPGIILIPESMLGEPNRLREVLLHELTHAATYASVLTDNSRSRTRLTKLMKIARNALTERGFPMNEVRGLEYALSNPEEFIAVAMTNSDVQGVLYGVELSPAERSVLGLGQRIANAFQAFVSWARDVLGLPPGYHSVMEGVIEVASTAIQSPAAQRLMLDRMVDPRLAEVNSNSLASMFSALDNVGSYISAENLGRGAANTGTGLAQFFKRVGLGFSTMRQLEMIGRELYNRDQRMDLLYPDRAGTPIEVAARAQNERAVVARNRLQKFLAPLKALDGLKPEQQTRVSELLIDATIAEAHPDADLGMGTPNEHLVGTAARQVQGRARHAVLKSRYDALTTAEKTAYKESVRTLSEAHQTAVRTIIGYQIDLWYAQQVDAHMRDATRNPMPVTHAGLTGLKERAESGSLTDTDKDMLGDTVFETLERARNRQKMKGPYVPLQRFGDYVVSWKENAPEFAAFPDRAAADAHIETSPYAALDVKEHHFDAAGDEITAPAPDILANEEGLALTNLAPDATPAERRKALQAAKRKAMEATRKRDSVRSETRVHQQINGLGMFESLAEAKQAREELRQGGKEVAEVRLRESPSSRASALQDADFERLSDAIKRDESLPQAYRDQAIDALASAYVSIIPNRVLQASLIKRRKVLGPTRDVKRVIANYGIAVSNFSAGMESALPITMALKSMREQERDGSRNSTADTGNSLSRGNMRQEMEQRLLSTPVDVAGGGSAIPWVRKLQSLAYIFYLASPSYSMIQMTQPWMLGLPVLSSRTSAPKAAAALGRAMGDVGLAQITKGGLKDSMNALRTMFGGMEAEPQPILADLKSRLTKLKDGGELTTMLESLEREGLVDGEAGLELVRAELTRDTAVGRKLGQAEALARAFPAAVEVVNRTSTAIAAYRLARESGKSIEQATAWAREVVDQSQADYSSSNTARLMDPRRHPWAAPMLTFRKYAQAVYFLLIRNTYLSVRGASPEVRKQARRTLMFTLATHASVAGVLGLPTEIINLALGAAALMFGKDEPWDWEKEVRQALSEAFGPEVGMMLARGIPRGLGVDLHARMGLNSLMFINDLRDFNQRSMAEYAGQFLMGAPGGMITSMLAAPGQIAAGQGGRAVESAVPKGLRDVLKAMRISEEGVTTRRGERIDESRQGEPGMSTSEMLIQALGFSPSRIAETYERRNAVQGANRQMTEERNGLIREYKQAPPAQRAAIWQRIMEWNRELPPQGRDARITRETLARSLREAARRTRTSGGGDYLPRGREFLRHEGDFAVTGR